MKKEFSSEPNNKVKLKTVESLGDLLRNFYLDHEPE